MFANRGVREAVHRFALVRLRRLAIGVLCISMIGSCTAGPREGMLGVGYSAANAADVRAPSEFVIAYRGMVGVTHQMVLFPGDALVSVGLVDRR